MCGIFGFVGLEPAPGRLVTEGLRRLEYRGYDSWGVATLTPGNPIAVVKQVGKISRTSEEDLRSLSEPAFAAIGHTRWATHGAPNRINAHPHLSASGRIAVVHNGIIENYRELRTLLESEGFSFVSETDTEVISHLLDRELHRTGHFHEALSRCLLELRGAFGLAILDREQPDRIFAVRMGSPLVVGVGDHVRFVSSDANALVAHTQQVIYLDDGEWADIGPDQVETFDFNRSATAKTAQQIDLELAATELGSFPHYMLKEIFDQPNAMRDALSGRLLRGEATVKLDGLVGLDIPARIKILACGSSWHAGMVGKYFFEELAGLPTEVEYASEFRYRSAVIEPGTLVIAMSQSGRPARELRESAFDRARRHWGSWCCWLVDHREWSRSLYSRRARSLGWQRQVLRQSLIILLLVAIHFGGKRRIPSGEAELLSALEVLPELLTVLEQNDRVREIVSQYVRRTSSILADLEYPIAAEGTEARRCPTFMRRDCPRRGAEAWADPHHSRDALASSLPRSHSFWTRWRATFQGNSCSWRSRSSR
ncbi:MAG: glutamine--fructose-6-phosphate transaminase (isomerizing) [Planctomycetota bacterium]